MTIRLLFVCTAGRCRSPIAAALFEKYVTQVAPAITARSVGLKFTGESTPPIGVSLMAEHGVDLARHRSSAVTKDLVKDADIILGMTREHVRDVVAMSPEAWPKTFTIKDFVRRAERIGPPRRRQRLDDWLESVGADRNPHDLLGKDPSDEVPDPFGQRARAWNRVIDDLDDLVSRLIPALGVNNARSATRAYSQAQGDDTSSEETSAASRGKPMSEAG